MLVITILTSATATNIKKQADIISKHDKLLLEADKEKTRANLLRAVSHDLRTPLTSIIGSSASYLENADSLSESEKRVLIQHIYEDSNWLLHMVENLLSISRASTRAAPESRNPWSPLKKCSQRPSSA